MSDIFEIIKQNMDLEDIDTVNYSPLTFAYIGDAIYELVIRTMIVDEANRSANDLHKMSSEYVKASTQAKLAEILMEDFDEEELAVFKRGRNTKINSNVIKTHYLNTNSILNSNYNSNLNNESFELFHFSFLFF